MTVYAKLYGFQIVASNEIKQEEDYTCLRGNCYLSNGEYEMREEILEKEF